MNKKQIQEISLLAQDYFLGHKGYNHHGCSLAIAKAFHFYTPAYHSLRRGGLTGEYSCGAIAAAELILGEIFGPIKADVQVDPKFLKIILIFRKQLARKLPRFKKNFICNDLMKFPCAKSTGYLNNYFPYSSPVAFASLRSPQATFGTSHLSPSSLRQDRRVFGRRGIKGFKNFNSLSRFQFCGQIVKKTAATLAETIEEFSGESRIRK